MQLAKKKRKKGQTITKPKQELESEKQNHREKLDLVILQNVEDSYG